MKENRYAMPQILQDKFAQRISDMPHSIDVNSLEGALKAMDENMKPRGAKGHPRDAFDSLLGHLRAAKPDDRSEADRYYAIVITEVEKAKAVFLTYCQLPSAE